MLTGVMMGAAWQWLLGCTRHSRLTSFPFFCFFLYWYRSLSCYKPLSPCLLLRPPILGSLTLSLFSGLQPLLPLVVFLT